MFDVEFVVDKYLLFLSSAICVFIYTIFLINESNKTIEEIILDEKTAVFTFFNKKKKKYPIERKELQIKIEP